MRVFFTFLLLNFQANVLMAQISESDPVFGNRAIQSGIWSVTGNPAGVSEIRSFTAGFYYRNAMWLPELGNAGFAAGMPVTANHAVAIGYSQFGYQLFTERYVCLAFAGKFGPRVSAGVRADYLNTAFGNDYGSFSAVTGSAGVMVGITDQVSAGCFVFNPARVKLGSGSVNRHPLYISAALKWNPGKHLEVSVGISKQTFTKEIFCADVIYRPAKRFLIRAGVSGGNNPFYFGYAFRMSSFEFGMVSGYHTETGFSPQATLTFKRD